MTVASTWRDYGDPDLPAPLAAALEAFTEQGYHGTTVRNIAARAGLSVPGLYHHYPSKQSLLQGLSERTMAELFARSEEALVEGGDDPVARFDNLIESLLRFHMYRRAQAFVGSTEIRSMDPASRAAYVAHRDRQPQMIDDAVRDGVRRVAGYPAPEGCGRALATMCNGVPAGTARTESLASTSSWTAIWLSPAIWSDSPAEPDSLETERSFGKGDPVAVDLSYSPEVLDIVERTRTFIETEVLPLENEHQGYIEKAGGDDLRKELNAKAKKAGIFAPHAPTEYGGLGLNMSDRSPVFTAGGRSTFGPLALHIGAPDEGNIHMLAAIASKDQKDEYLAPLAAGDLRSAFAMTEPPPGAGADPNNLTTAATKVPGGWKINGRKRFITGADGAGFYIIMARTKGEPGDRGGATMFLAPGDAKGISVDRYVHTYDRAMIGGHCEMTFDDLFVPDSGVLGEPHEGYRYAQVRLGPARMTHVMRWMGIAERARDIALDYVTDRQGFGGRMGDLGMMQQMIADNEIDLQAAQALLTKANWELDQGEHASDSTSIAKTFGAEAFSRVLDRSIQMCGGLGVSEDLPLARLANELRPFRIYDGPSEVHRWAIAKRAVGRTRKAHDAGIRHA